MGGVDLNDRMISYYRNKYRTNRWTLRTILHFFDLASVNVWLLYRKDEKVKRGKPMKFLDFRITLAEQMITGKLDESESASDEDEEEPPSKRIKLPCKEARMKGASHMPEIVDLPNPNRCRNELCRKGKSRVRCMRCNMFLCLTKDRNCYLEFHSA